MREVANERRSKLDSIKLLLLERIASLLGPSAPPVDVSVPLSCYGLDSITITNLFAQICAELDRPALSTLAWRYPTIASLARYLASEESVLPARASDNVGRVGDRLALATADEPIAIVGMACRFPKARDLEAFWRLLREGQDAIGEVPPGRWDAAALYSTDAEAPSKANTRRGGFIDQVDRFDAAFFGISPREATQMDPQQRLMLELAWEALEDAGVPPPALAGTRSGVFVGAMWVDYARGARGRLDSIAQHTVTGQDTSILSGRVSYALGLQGPSITVNTACSSSLVAIHLACQSLLRGESQLALAGGVNLMLAPESTVAMSKFGGLSPDGVSRAFDARANGYVRGEGGGVVVLKPLSHALLAGDPIYAVIRGSAVNNDGPSNGLTAPNPRAQEALLRAVYARADLRPADVQYVEAHGTGTSLGDPIEARALAAVMCADRGEDSPLRLGSVKTNIGHLEAAAGVAGLIKTALAIKHGHIPASLHFEQPNPHIPFDDLGLRVQVAGEPWPDDGRKPLAGVSAFGFSGTNCHVVLEGVGALRHERLFAFAAPSEAALEDVARASAALAEERWSVPSGQALCSLSAVQQGRGEHRLAVIARSAEELTRKLEGFVEGAYAPGVVRGRAGARPPKIAFVFGGHGSQWAGMGRYLCRSDSAFRAAILACDEAMRPHAGFSIMHEILRAEGPEAMPREVLQPAIFTVQVALAALWRSLGVAPDAVIGQSIGEVAAAHVAGALSLDDAAKVICSMSKVVERLVGHGGAALVDLPADEVEQALLDYPERLWIAGSMSPECTLVSGHGAALDELLVRLHARAVLGRRARIDYASHSPHTAALGPELLRALEGLSPLKGATPFYSTVTGDALASEALDGAYWARNLGEPVLLTSAVERILAAEHDVLLEIGPHPLLTRVLQQSVRYHDSSAVVLHSLRRDEPGKIGMYTALGALYARGASIAWHRLSPMSDLPGAAPPSSGEALEPRTATVAAESSEPLPAEMITLSGRSRPALEDGARALIDWLRQPHDVTLRDCAYTAATRRAHHAHRLALVGRSPGEMAAAAEAFLSGEAHAGAVEGAGAGEGSGLVFVYSGQGSHWAGMGCSLLEEFPVFRAAIEACDASLRRFKRWSLLSELQAPASASRLHETEVAQPALVAVQIALTELWQSWGVQPAAVVGHSVGELTAAYVSGALSLDEAMRVVHHRGLLMQRAAGRGRMAAVEASAGQAAEALRGYEDRAGIAAVNGPTSVVLSGDAAALREVLSRLQQEGARSRELSVDFAFHSPQMDPFGEQLTRALGYVELGPMRLPMYSTVTGQQTEAATLDAGYWARNLRAPVEFAQAVRAAIASGARSFLEVSAHPALALDVEQCLSAAGVRGQVLSSLRRGREARLCLLRTLAALYASGRPITWRNVYPEGGQSVSLPAYPFQRERYWLEPASAEPVAPGSPAASAALRALLDAKDGAALAQQLRHRAVFSPEELPVLTRLLDALRGEAQARAPAEECASYEIAWRAQAPVRERRHRAGHWIILIDEGGTGEQLAAALEVAGARCSRVRLAASSSRSSAEPCVDPASPGSFDAWWEQHGSKQGPVRGVVHLWSLDAARVARESVDAAAGRSVESALACLQWLARVSLEGSPRLWCVTSGAVSVGDADPLRAPEQAPLWGFGRVAALERPELWGGLIDIGARCAAAPIAALVDHLFDPAAEAAVALRASGAFVPRLVPRSASGSPPAPWSTRGTALITGGLGALGLHVARWLARGGATHIVLTSRTGTDSVEAEAARASIEALGATVTVARADVADERAMAAVIEAIDARHPPLAAVFHAAGCWDNTPLVTLGAERLREVMAAKVRGTLVLDALTRGRALDACVCFSSIASGWGSAGQAAYAAANAFQDAWAVARRAEGLAATSVSFGPWSGGGMMDAATLASLERRGLRALRPEAAIRSLARLLSERASRGIVADVDLAQLASLHESCGQGALFAEVSRPPQTPPRTEEPSFLGELAACPLEQRRRALVGWLQRTVAQILGIRDAARVCPDQGFFELGMDSLMNLELRRRVQRGLGVALSSTATFNYPSIAAMTDFLLRELGFDEREMARHNGALVEEQPLFAETAAETVESDIERLTHEEALHRLACAVLELEGLPS